MTTKSEMLALLNAHDVWYQHSDDFTVWRLGQRQFDEIESASWESDENRQIFDAFFKKLNGEKIREL